MFLFTGDHVDQIILTINGRGTFHGMGIIATLIQGRKKDRVIQRRNFTSLDFSMQSRIPITEHRFAKHVRQTTASEQLPALVSCDRTIDVPWELSLNFRQETLGWQGMMHTIHQGLEHPGQSSIVFLPMTNLYPGDKTCIPFYSRLRSRCQTSCSTHYYVRSTQVLESCRDHRGCTRE